MPERGRLYINFRPDYVSQFCKCGSGNYLISIRCPKCNRRMMFELLNINTVFNVLCECDEILEINEMKWRRKANDELGREYYRLY